MSLSPNVLFIIADDHQSACVGAHGNHEVKTPVIDCLAAEGCDFQRAYIMGGCSAAVCIPSRASLLTARNPLTAVGLDATQIIAKVNPKLPLLPEWFRQAGWHTHGIGKWHNGREGFHRCFDSGATIFFKGMCDHDAVPVHAFDPRGIYSWEESTIHRGKFSSELFCDEAVDFIHRRKSENESSPFFLYLALTSPHDPRTPPPSHAGMYSPADITLPANFAPEHPFDNGELNIRDELLCPTPRSPEDIKQELAAYYGMISHHDEQIGRVISALEATGELENTIIVYLSDHGVALGRHGLLGKQNLYEHSITVPLILRGPGIPAERKIKSLVYSFDLFPTLCDLTRIAPPPGLEGKSMVPLFHEPSVPIRDEIFSFYKDIQHSITDGCWKLIEYRANRQIRYQLFDLEQDPLELSDRAEAPECSLRLNDLKERLTHWKKTTVILWPDS